RTEVEGAVGKKCSYSNAMRLLSQLVSEDEKPETRSVEELAQQMGNTWSRDSIKEVLERLKERHLTKIQTDPTGIELWTLYHEFLVKVLERLRDPARRSEMRLEEAYRRFV